MVRFWAALAALVVALGTGASELQISLQAEQAAAHEHFLSAREKEALGALNALEEKGMLWSQGYEDLAVLAREAKDKVKAGDYLAKALELDPFSSRAHYLAFQWAREAGDKKAQEHHGRWFTGLLPKDGRAAAMAESLGLKRTDYGYYRPDEIEALQKYLASWAAYFADREQTFYLQSRAPGADKTITIRTQLTFHGVMWAEDHPAAHLTFEESLDYGDGTFQPAGTLELLVGREATVKAMSFLGPITLPGSGPDLEFLFRTSTTLRGGKLHTLSRGVGIKGKWVNETFRFTFDPREEMEPRVAKSLWGKITHLDRPKILEQIAASQVRCQVWGWGTHLDSTVSAVLLAQMELPKKPSKVPILHLIVPHAGISNRSITFREFSSYGSPFLLGSYQLKKQNNVKSVKIGKQRLEVVTHQLDTHRVMVHPSGRIVKLDW